MVKNIMIGGVEQNKAIVSGKVPYSTTAPTNSPKILTLVYNQVDVKVYLNGELINTVANAGNAKYMSDIYIGADYDDTEHFKGILPVLSFYNKALPDAQRVLLERWMADRWLPTGEKLADGYTIQETAGAKPTWDTALGQAFMDFDDSGLVMSGGRVTSWNDSTTLGSIRVATPKAGTTLGTRTVKGKNALLFDNSTFLMIPILNNAANGPDPLTITMVLHYDDFDTSPYPGDSAQTVLGAANNSAFRFKKFDSDSYMDVRFTTGASGNSTIQVPRDKFLVPGAATGNAMVKAEISDLEDFSIIRETSVETLAEGNTNYGTVQHVFTSLTPDTKYYGRFIVDGVTETGNNFSFKTLSDKQSFKIITGSCNRTGSTSTVWAQMLAEKADMFVHTGDLHYLDIGTAQAQDYANGTDQALASPQMSNFFKNQAMMYIFDNHDSVGVNPNKYSNFSAYLPYYQTVFPTYPLGSNDILADGIYTSWTMGRVRCIVTGMRTHRDPIQAPDSPTKTTLGVVQKQWLKDQLLAAKAAGESIIWFTSICYIADGDNPLGQSLDATGMSWGSYPDERKELANFIYENQIKNVTIVSSDSHMQAMDDGRNSIYATDVDGNRIQYGVMEEEYLIPVLCASPFDQYVAYEGGPFQINEIENSGGPFPSYEESYGVIDVIDRGENWIQITLILKVREAGTWKTLKKYTYNRVMAGDEGLPPLVNENLEGINDNGYIGYNSEWEEINRRFIAKDGDWKPVAQKIIGKNGLWKLAYNETSIDYTNPFYIHSLQGYDYNAGNVVEIYGKGFLDSQFPTPRRGGYFEFKTGVTDLFGNISAASIVGTNTQFTPADGIRGLLITAEDSYIALNSNIDSGFNSHSMIGYTGANDTSFSIWVHVPTLGAKKFIFFYGTAAEYGTMYINPTGNIVLEFKKDGVVNSVTTPETLSIGWNRISWNRKAANEMYSTIHINAVKSTIDMTGFVIPGMATLYQIFIGGGRDEAGVMRGASGLTFTNLSVMYLQYLSGTNISILAERPTPKVYFKSLTDGSVYVVNDMWTAALKNEVFSFTVPPTAELPNDDYELYLDNGYYRSRSFKVKVVPPRILNTPLTVDFSDPQAFSDNFYALHRAWGGANGGVVTDNVLLERRKLILRGHGDRYTGDVQGTDMFGKPKFHTNPLDPKFGQPWTHRVGACVVLKKRTGYGSYRVVGKIPNHLGVCYAMWTFFYQEIYPGSPYYQQFKDEGLHEQGSFEQGYYIVKNHEIDIEFPSHLDGGAYNQPSLSNMKCNTWRGELQNWDVPKTDPAYWEEYRDNLVPVGFSIADGNEHELRFDWHNDRVEFYIDGVLKRTNVNKELGNSDTIPNIHGHFTLGLWFPSSPLQPNNWLVNPARAWAGGVINPVTGGMEADFDTIDMEVSSFSFTPFSEPGEELKGETYPFGGYRIKKINGSV